MMPFHILPLHFRVEMLKPTLFACRNTEQKIISFVSICLTFLKWRLLFAELYGLRSVSAVPNGHKFSDNLSFQSSPELHCALFQVLLQFRPAPHLSYLMATSTLFLLGSVEAARGRPLWGWSWMLVLPSLKCFTHHLTLLAPMHTSPYTRWSLWWISAAGISSLTRNSMMARWQNETSLSAILYHLFMVTWCKLLTPYLTQRYDNSWRHLPNDTQSFDVAELPTMRRCSWLSVWPSYIWRKCVICSWCSCFNVDIYILVACFIKCGTWKAQEWC